MFKAQVAIIGGGIVGLAHAYIAARRGMSVVLFERNERPQGASIRNFGMIWPIGQPSGDRLQLALRSRAIWEELIDEAGLEIVSRGSLHLAYEADEAAVIREFAASSERYGYTCSWWSPDQIQTQCSGVRQDGLIGGLWSETELVVDPREVSSILPRFLSEKYDVQIRMGVPAQAIEPPFVRTAMETWEVERVLLCNGDDFLSFYPEVFAASGMILCKLQMMRTGPQPSGWRLGAALAGGLTLRFYPSFQVCSSLPRFQRRIETEMPEYQQYGIHVMAAQTPDGAITIGDSHEYGLDISVFDKPLIDELILDYLGRFLKLPNPAIAEHWHGVYAKHPHRPYFTASPAPGVRIVTGLGGAGMTLSFGVAEKTWEEWT